MKKYFIFEIDTEALEEVPEEEKKFHRISFAPHGEHFAFTISQRVVTSFDCVSGCANAKELEKWFKKKRALKKLSDS